MQRLKIVNNHKREVLQHLRKIRHLLPDVCTITFSNNTPMLSPFCTPPEYDKLYDKLKKAGMLDAFITYGEFLIFNHNREKEDKEKRADKRKQLCKALLQIRDSKLYRNLSVIK